MLYFKLSLGPGAIRILDFRIWISDFGFKKTKLESSSYSYSKANRITLHHITLFDSEDEDDRSNTEFPRFSAG